MSQPNIKEIEWAISELLQQESSFTVYARLADLCAVREYLSKEDETLEPLTRQTLSAQVEPMSFSGGSEFLQLVSRKDQMAVWDIIDELMDTLKVVNPKVYDSVMRKIDKI